VGDRQGSGQGKKNMVEEVRKRVEHRKAGVGSQKKMVRGGQGMGA
jgi:hypothetical protein